MKKYMLELKIFPYGTNEYIPVLIEVGVDGHNLILDIKEGKHEKKADEKLVINIFDEKSDQERVAIPLDHLGLPDVGVLRRWLIALSETAGEIEMHVRD